MILFRKFGLVCHCLFVYLGGGVNLSVTADSGGEHKVQTLVIVLDVDVTGKYDSFLAYKDI